MITALLSTLAFAEDPAATPPATPPATEPAKTAPAPAALPVFEDFDANKDLNLEKAEVSKHEVLTRDFALVDTDKNGKLSQAEFKAWADKLPKL